MDFAQVLGTLARFFADHDQPFAVVGGLGLAAHGIGRTTLDVDIVADAAAQDTLISFLESEGYETLHRSSGYSNHLHTDPELGRVDVVYLRGETSREVFEGSTRRAGPGGLQVPVPRAEHLAAMKLFAVKNDPRRAPRELVEVLELMEIPGIDVEEIRSYLAKYGLEEALARLEDLR